MAEKRMFNKSIVLSDSFLDMPATARCLYFTLNMLADDDGFVNSPKSIMRQCMATVDDMKILLAKCYLIPFDSGIVVIRHWRINNYLRCDRYTPTKFLEEKAQLLIEKDGSYSKIENQNELVQKAEPIAIEQKIEIEEKKTDVSRVQEKSVSDNSSKKEKLAPLVDRESRNDIEQVEKEYLLNYNKLYNAGVLRSSKPIINWTVSRKLTKEVIKKYGLETIIQAVKKSITNNFCIQKGYALNIILSTGVLSELINGGVDPPKRQLQEKYDMSDLLGG